VNKKIVDGETVNTITLSDNSTVTERFNSSGLQTQRVIADQSGDQKISNFDASGSETISYADEFDQAIDKSEVDIMVDYGFENTDLGFENVDITEITSGYASNAENFVLSVGGTAGVSDYNTDNNSLANSASTTTVPATTVANTSTGTVTTATTTDTDTYDDNIDYDALINALIDQWAVDLAVYETTSIPVTSGSGFSFNYLPTNDEKGWFEAAGSVDANDYLFDANSDGFGKVSLYTTAKGELTSLQSEVPGIYADWDLYHMVDMTSGYTLTPGNYAVKVSNATWDYLNEDYIGNVSSFKVITHTNSVVGEQAFHGDYYADTVAFTAYANTDYFVQVEGSLFGDAQYEITLDII
jgi:hypothetical protein